MAKRFGSKPHVEEEWSEKGVNDYKQKIKKYSSRFRPDNPAKILFVGETFVGKSSLINSFEAALRNDIVYAAAVGHNYTNTTKQYLEHKVESDEGILNFLLCDSRGIGKDFQRGAPLEEFDQLFEGKFRHKEIIKSEEGLTHLKQSSDCEEDDDYDKCFETAGKQTADQDFKPPNGVVFVQNANRLGDPDLSVERKLQYVYKLADKKGIPSCLVLTHIDEFKPSLKKQLEKALTSKTVHKLVQHTARLTNFAANRVFVVWSYTDEQCKPNVKQNLLLLRALYGILVDVAQKYADDECGQLSPSYQNTNPIQHFQRTPDYTSQQSELARNRLRLSGFSTTRKGKHYDQRSIKSEPDSARSYSSQMANQSDSAYYTHSGEISSRYKRTMDEEEMPYSIPEDVTSTYLGFGENRSSSSVGTNPSDLLQESIQELSTSKNIYPDDYTQVQLKGAKSLFNPEILQLKSTELPEESGLILQLEKENMSRDELIAWDDVKTWAGSPNGSAWISHTLPVDLGIPLVQPFPNSLKLQIFFLAPKRPAFFLSIYSSKYIRDLIKYTKISEKEKVLKDEKECVQDFTTKMSRLMSSLLLNYCHSDFILLPCILSDEEINAPNLQKQIDEQIQKAKRYYGGPLNLTSRTYAKLKVATTAVVSSTHVAGFLDDTSSKEERVLLLDKVWQRVVSLAIEKLHDTSQCEGTYYYEKQAMTKVQIAVLEAAKRYSFQSEVQIISSDIKLNKCAERLRKQVKQDTGLDLKLRVCRPEECKDLYGVCVFLDCSDCFESLPENVLSICQRKCTK